MSVRPPPEGPARYRAEAKKLREQADGSRSSAHLKSELLRIADEYEKLAAAVERSSF